MKQFGNKLLPEIGYIFNSNGILTFTVPVDAEYEEIPINQNNISIVGDFAFVDGKFAIKINDVRPLKARLINKLYSNDDQIAIILNKDKENLAFMNSWRDWFSKIINIIYATK